VLRVAQFWDHVGPRLKPELLEAVKQVIANYLFNSSLPFHVDAEDGLVSLRPHTGLALTWMDAKIGGEPVTPRYGKPIEINALWFNALSRKRSCTFWYGCLFTKLRVPSRWLGFWGRLLHLQRSHGCSRSTLQSRVGE
jgi:glycogen debranching enzyme